MQGFKPAARAAAKKGGAGPVRGPGTGTSDDVKDAVPPGTYIMPADSTQQLGEPALAGLGFKPKEQAGGEVPVNLSNGEYKLPPEQVHAVGAQVLDAMKDATHAPVQARGFRPGMREQGVEPPAGPGLGFHPGGEAPPQKATNELYFADGGLVDDQAKKRRPLATSPTNTYPGNQAEAAGNIYAKSNAELAQGARDAGGFVARGFPGTTTALKGAGEAIQDAYKQGGVGAAIGQGFRGAMVPAVGLADDVMGSAAKVLDPAAQALKTLVTGDATPIGQATAAAPPSAKPAQPAAASTPAAPTAPSAAPANPNYGNEPNAPANPQAAPAALANNVSREGNSYSGKDIGPGFTINGKEPGGGFVSGAAQPGGAGQGVGGPEVLGILQRENQIRAGMGPLADQVAFNNGTGGMFRNTTNDEIVRRMLTGNSGRERRTALDFMAGRQDAANRTVQAQQELDMREMDAMSRRDLAAGEFDLKSEAQGFQTAAARRLQGLQDKFMAEKDPAKRAELAQTIRDLNGKQDPRFTVVPGGQEWDANAGAMRNMPSRVLNNQTERFVDGERQAGAQPQAMPTDKSKLAAGQIYQTARGPARWDGNQFVGV